MNEKILIGTILAIMAVFTVPAAADNVMYFVPQDSIAEASEDTMTVKLMLNTSHDDFGGFGASIIFDTNVINLTNVELDSTPFPEWDTWGWDHRGDHVFIIATEFSGTGPGELELGEITLQRINPGESGLDFQLGVASTSCADIYAVLYPDFTAINGTVTFEGEIPYETFEKDLVAGWNLVSLPLTSEDNSVSTVLASIDGNYDAVMTYTPGAGYADAATMDPGNGYFIHMTSDDTWTYDGAAYIAIIKTILPGLNLVGWNNTSDPISALSSIEGHYNYVARWNAAEQKFEVYEPNAPDELNDIDMMERGKRYFIAATDGCTLT